MYEPAIQHVDEFERDAYEMEMEVQRQEADDEARHDAMAEREDPHHYDFIPGYATEMDWMNACEADDYRHEGDDIEF